MRIEAGKSYRTRDGRKACVIEVDLGSAQPWKCRHSLADLWHWEDGRCNVGDGGYDLIAEWTDAPDLTAITTPFGLLDDATRKALKAHGGPYQCWSLGSAGPWTDLTWEFDWLDMHVYRVKPQPPKPRDFWVNVYIGGLMAAHSSKEDALRARAADILQTIHVREVT